MLDRFSEWLEEGSLYVALLVAWVAMLGSLYFSDVAGYIPCTFCWYQRILMYPLTIVLAVGLLRRDQHLPLYVLPFSVIGIGVASYHYLLQKTDLFTNVSTCQVGVPCSGIWVNWLGFITIPFLSLSAFLIITLMAIIAWQAGVPFSLEMEDDENGDRENDGRDDTLITRPWIPVVGIIALVLIVFFILGQSGTASVETHTSSVEHGTESESAVTAQAGQQLYSEACAACHGAAAEGVPNLGSALTESTLLNNATEAEILAYIRQGSAIGDANNSSGIAMPPSGGRPDLSDDALLSIIRYLRTKIAETGIHHELNWISHG